MNLALALLVLGGGGLLAYSGITNQAGGVTGQLGRILRGQSSTGTTSTSSAAQLASFLTGGAAATSAAGGTASSASATTSAATGTPAAVVAAAAAQEGKPYRWGAAGPDAFDCSGLTQWAYAHGAGVQLPRVAAAQQLAGHAVPNLSAALPGDLLFYGLPAYHCALYVGGGRQIAAPHGGTTVQEQAVDTAHLTSIRRILGAASSPAVSA